MDETTAKRERCRVGTVSIGGGGRLAIIAGPCVLEEPATNERIGRVLREVCGELDLPYVYKASFDKANRSSLGSARGPGLRAGLDELARLKDALGVPVTTDVHEAAQAAETAEVVDLLQVPAFLCRQTDLLVACGETGRAVNVKKGQFMSPAEMGNVLSKVRASRPGGTEGGRPEATPRAGSLPGAGAGAGVILTERGTFFGYQRLVNDFIGLGDLMELGAPVCFDVTHSTQLPGGEKTSTGGRPERAPLLARAAAAAGVDALFLECHPDPRRAKSDAATMLSLEEAERVVRAAARVWEAAQSG